MTREDVWEKLKTVEHPEIAASLIDLGMIIDVSVDGDTATLALAFPMKNIPQAVVDAIVDSASEAVKDLGLDMKTKFFEMSTEARENFLAKARTNWKGSI